MRSGLADAAAAAIALGGLAVLPAVQELLDGSRFSRDLGATRNTVEKQELAFAFGDERLRLPACDRDGFAYDPDARARQAERIRPAVDAASRELDGSSPAAAANGNGGGPLLARVRKPPFFCPNPETIE